LRKAVPIVDKKILEEILRTNQIKFVKKEPLSSLLRNVILNGLESTIKQHFEKSRDKVDRETGERSKVNVIRYMDDLVITGSNKIVLEKAKEILKFFLDQRGLDPKKSKIKIINIKKGFSFLDFHFQRYEKDLKRNKRNRNLETVLVIKSTSKAEKEIKNRISEIIEPNRSIKTIMRNLNPILRS